MGVSSMKSPCPCIRMPTVTFASYIAVEKGDRFGCSTQNRLINLSPFGHNSYVGGRMSWIALSFSMSRPIIFFAQSRQ